MCSQFQPQCQLTDPYVFFLSGRTLTFYELQTTQQAVKNVVAQNAVFLVVPFLSLVGFDQLSGERYCPHS
jgi:hypothetical protein